MGKRELIALLNLSSWCLVMVEGLFLAVPRGCLQFVIVVFPDHTHLLFLMLSLLFISALWSPAWRRLASWLLLVMFSVFCYFPMWYPGVWNLIVSFPVLCHRSYFYIYLIKKLNYAYTVFVIKRSNFYTNSEEGSSQKDFNFEQFCVQLNC